MFYLLALPTQWRRSLLLLGGLWLLFLLPAAAQPDSAAVLRVERLPAAGLLLQKGWRYHAGDDPAWARPDFDDSRWDTLNPTRPRRELPARLGTGISWLRLRFRLADSLRHRPLRLQAVGYGAWEVYLNGRLAQRAGTVQARLAQAPDPDNLPSVVVPAGGPAEQVLTIRFAAWQSPLGRLTARRPLLELRLLGEAQAQEQAAKRLRNATTFSMIAGIFALLTLLHLAFFRYYPAQRANFYFALFALAMAGQGLAVVYRSVLTFSNVVPRLLLMFIGILLVLAAYLWAVRALYALFGFRPGRVYNGLWIGFWLMTALLAYDVDYSTYVFATVNLAAVVELLRLTARALRQRRRGAWIVGAGFAVAFLVLVVVLSFSAASTLLKVSNPLAQAAAGVFSYSALLLYLPPPLGISLYLAREFALNSQLLQVKLGEVEKLSAQTLAQEQEKQALLAQQNEMLEAQVQQRTGELQRSLTDLRATQAQLIQKEKMASLGELTAGIAHEIQNPLNFVNNFADVSTELLDELAEEQARPTPDTELEAELVGDLRQNLTKIHQHGRRAASIVRGMLEHSRQSTGERAPVAINALADEYLRLAYHGLRAKDKSFNADLKTDFAPDLPRVEGVGPDLGRVLLNLFMNAFYAVQQRQQAGEAAYAPSVSVSTRHVGSMVEIQVQDNGTGMPESVKAKIFQPFFTTKPTGEGTGLGLSLSHDIIAQGHGGTLTVESQPGQGTTFTISLPC